MREFRLGERFEAEFERLNCSDDRFEQTSFQIAERTPSRLVAGHVVVAGHVEDIVICDCGVPLLPLFDFVFASTFALFEAQSHSLMQEGLFRSVHVWHFYPRESFATQVYSLEDRHYPDTVGARAKLFSQLAHAYAIDQKFRSVGLPSGTLFSLVWASSSWDSLLVAAQGQTFLAACFQGRWKLVQGSLDELVASIPSRESFIEASAARTEMK
jgi:hypothetical protein